ncbi:MAG: hypothetical protein AAB701_00315 [Patescibacteria group bacterium]
MSTDIEKIEEKILRKLPSSLDDAVRRRVAREINSLAEILISEYRAKKQNLKLHG